jgi:hypothetical protein
LPVPVGIEFDSDSVKTTAVNGGFDCFQTFHRNMGGTEQGVDNPIDGALADRLAGEVG